MRRAGQLKRQRTTQEPSEDDPLGEAELVNKRIRVLWPGEGQFFSGTISGPGGSLVRSETNPKDANPK